MVDDISFMDDFPKRCMMRIISDGFSKEISSILLGGRRSFAIPTGQSIYA
jgi:hypothetical protein